MYPIGQLFKFLPLSSCSCRILLPLICHVLLCYHHLNRLHHHNNRNKWGKNEEDDADQCNPVPSPGRVKTENSRLRLEDDAHENLSHTDRGAIDIDKTAEEETTVIDELKPLVEVEEQPAILDVITDVEGDSKEGKVALLYPVDDVAKAACKSMPAAGSPVFLRAFSCCTPFADASLPPVSPAFATASPATSS